MSRLKLIFQAGQDEYDIDLLTTTRVNLPAATDYFTVIIEGENLPSLQTTDFEGVTITSSTHDPDTSTFQLMNIDVTEIKRTTLVLHYAGRNYTLEVYAGQQVNTIQPYAGGTFQSAPITETWHSSDMVSNRPYNVYFTLDTNIPTGSDIISPPDITESAAAVASTPDDYYKITLHPKTGGFTQAGEYDFKCNGVTFLHVIAVND